MNNEGIFRRGHNWVQDPLGTGPLEKSPGGFLSGKVAERRIFGGSLWKDKLTKEQPIILDATAIKDLIMEALEQGIGENYSMVRPSFGAREAARQMIATAWDGGHRELQTEINGRPELWGHPEGQLNMKIKLADNTEDFGKLHYAGQAEVSGILSNNLRIPNESEGGKRFNGWLDKAIKAKIGKEYEDWEIAKQFSQDGSLMLQLREPGADMKKAIVEGLAPIITKLDDGKNNEGSSVRTIKGFTTSLLVKGLLAADLTPDKEAMLVGELNERKKSLGDAIEILTKGNRLLEGEVERWVVGQLRQDNLGIQAEGPKYLDQESLKNIGKGYIFDMWRVITQCEINEMTGRLRPQFESMLVMSREMRRAMEWMWKFDDVLPKQADKNEDWTVFLGNDDKVLVYEKHNKILEGLWDGKAPEGEGPVNVLVRLRKEIEERVKDGKGAEVTEADLKKELLHKVVDFSTEEKVHDNLDVIRMGEFFNVVCRAVRLGVTDQQIRDANESLSRVWNGLLCGKIGT